MTAEFSIVRSDGCARTIMIDSASSPGENGMPGILFGTVRDVTSAKARGERLRALETQLHHSQKLESLGTLAHDLNNALRDSAPP